MRNGALKHKNIGSDFKDLLREEGIFEECKMEAKKRLLNDQKMDTIAAKIAHHFPGRSVSDLLRDTDYRLERLEYMLSIMEKNNASL